MLETLSHDLLHDSVVANQVLVDSLSSIRIVKVEGPPLNLILCCLTVRHEVSIELGSIEASLALLTGSFHLL